MTGNFVFALAAGPAMIAALTRFRERFQWRQVEMIDPGGETGGGDPSGGAGPGGKGHGRARGAAGLTMLLVGCLLVVFGGHGTPRAEAAYTAEAGNAASWLRAQQNPDGGFASTPEGTSSVSMTARAMFALAATGINPLDVKTNATPYGYLVNHRSDITSASDIALTILAMKTVGQDPKDFKGRNLIKALRDRRGNGSFGNDINVTSFAVLAFRSAAATQDAQYSLKWLNSAQNDNGGWGIASNADSDADSTGAALMAVTAENAGNLAINYLNSIQKDSGGFASSGTVNSQSTGLVIQGLIAHGKSMNYLRKNGNSGADYLLARQQSDGSIWYSKDSDTTRVWVTADATTALAGQPLPIAAPPREKADDNSNNTGGSAPDGSGSSTGSSTPTYTPSPGSLVSPSTGSPSTGTGGEGGPVGGDNNPGNGGGTGTDDDASSEPATELPPADTTIPLVPAAPTDAVLAASERGPEPSPLIAILIALGVAGGLCGGTILLVRRFRW